MNTKCDQNPDSKACMYNGLHRGMYRGYGIHQQERYKLHQHLLSPTRTLLGQGTSAGEATLPPSDTSSMIGVMYAARLRPLLNGCCAAAAPGGCCRALTVVAAAPHHAIHLRDLWRKSGQRCSIATAPHASG